MAKQYQAADGSTYTLKLAGRRGEALERYWAGAATSRETLNTLRGKRSSAAPSEVGLGSAEKVGRESAGSPPVCSAARECLSDSPSGATKPDLAHKVEPSPEGFVVTSGRSGQTYLVVPLETGGASCNCEAGKRAIYVSRCSHVRAVEAFATEVLKKEGEE